jgi:hypothetical protein
MNIAIIIVFLIVAWTINAEVKVISVIMTMLSSSHAKELSRVINLQEDKGCVLFNFESYNSATYLYFRCSKKE